MRSLAIPERFRSSETQILRLKSDLARISRSRLVAYREGRLDDASRAQIRLLETELKNIEALASYVKGISPAAARELLARRATVAMRFERLKAAADLSALQSWLKEELAPLVNKSEQAAHLVATSIRLEKDKEPTPFAWRMR